MFAQISWMIIFIRAYPSLCRTSSGLLSRLCLNRRNCKCNLSTQSLVIHSCQRDSIIFHNKNFLQPKGVLLTHPPLSWSKEIAHTTYSINKGIVIYNSLKNQINQTRALLTLQQHKGGRGKKLPEKALKPSACTHCSHAHGWRGNKRKNPYK